MRIGVFGNTNNYPLLLTMALRRLGHNAVLAVNRPEPLHRPEAKFAEFSRGYPDWILDCAAIPEADFIAPHQRIEGVLNFLAHGSDAVILNDIGPSLHAFCGVPALAFLTGADASHYADPGMPANRMRTASPEWVASPAGRFVARQLDGLVERQRDGIRQAVGVSAPVPGMVPVIDRLLEELGVTAGRRDFVYFGDTFRPPVMPRAAAGPLRIVSGARLNWRRPMPEGYSSQDHKGTDVLLHGFADFVASGGDAELVLFRKGLHVAETEALARTLGIDGRIRWHEEVSPAAFAETIRQADIVCDQLGDSFPGMAALDAMAIGLPVVANFGTALTTALFEGHLPACQAATPNEVAAHLEALAASSDLRAEIGSAARAFVRSKLSPQANAEKCLRLLGRAA